MLNLHLYINHFVFLLLMSRRPPRSTRLTHSFPTRRSSDLSDRDQRKPCGAGRRAGEARAESQRQGAAWQHLPLDAHDQGNLRISRPAPSRECGARRRERSEEHTSELQSLMRISYAVFCLKKKKIKMNVNKNKKLTGQ